MSRIFWGDLDLNKVYELNPLANKAVSFIVESKGEFTAIVVEGRNSKDCDKRFVMDYVNDGGGGKKMGWQLLIQVYLDRDCTQWKCLDKIPLWKDKEVNNDKES